MEMQPLKRLSRKAITCRAPGALAYVNIFLQIFHVIFQLEGCAESRGLSNLRGKMAESEAKLNTELNNARAALDSWVREIIAWHFNPETGCPFWLDYARNLDWDPPREIHTYADLARFGFCQDEALRGGPVRRWIPRGLADR